MLGKRERERKAKALELAGTPSALVTTGRRGCRRETVRTSGVLLSGWSNNFGFSLRRHKRPERQGFCLLRTSVVVSKHRVDRIMAALEHQFIDVLVDG